MKLSFPIYHLKHQAKILARTEGIPLNQALNRIAVTQGFTHWSLLAAQTSSASPAKTLLAQLSPGDLILLGALPNHGKTQLSLELTVEAMQLGQQGVFFSLEYNKIDILNLFKSINKDPTLFQDKFTFDSSDVISADYIIAHLATAPANTMVVIDYLQLLDQKRKNPEIMIQIKALKKFAIKRSLIMIFISQIDRDFDPSAGVCPSFEDVRLPNPLDLKLFNKACFLNDGKLEISITS